MTDVDPASVWPEDADDVDEAVVANWFVRDGASEIGRAHV